jgi:mitochondrial chaperone BCS1
MLWLSRRPEWQRSREFETTTRTALPGGSSATSSSSNASPSTYRSAEDDDWDQWEVAVSGNSGSNADAGPGEDGEGRPKTRVVFQPTYDTTHTIFYKGHWLRVRRGRKQETGSEMLSIRYLATLFFLIFQLTPSYQRRCTFQCHSQTIGSSGKKGIRS